MSDLQRLVSASDEVVAYKHGDAESNDRDVRDGILALLDERDRLRAALEGLIREWDENGPFSFGTVGNGISEQWLLSIEQARAALGGSDG